MTLLICLPLIVVVGGLTARRWFVASRQDIRSIESHRSNLHHLEHLAPDTAASGHGSPAGSAHVRVVGPTGVAAGARVRPMTWGPVDGRAPAARPAWHAPREDPVPGRYEKARRAAERARPAEVPVVVITDEAVAPGSAPPGEPVVPEAEAPATVVIDDLEAQAPRSGPPPAPTPAPTPIPGSSGRRAPVALASAAGLLVVAGAAGAAVVTLHPFSPSTSHHATAAPARSPGPSGSPAGGRARTEPPPPPTTTPPALTAVSSTATDATYSVTGGQLQLSLDASSACWLELRTGSPAGPVVYEGTIQPGSSQSFSAGTGAWLRLGDPGGVQLRINGSSVALPPVANPFNVTVTSA